LVVAPLFLLVDSQDKTKKFEVLNNPALEAGRGAGVAASQALASHGVKAVICGGVGPNAFRFFNRPESFLFG